MLHLSKMMCLTSLMTHIKAPSSVFIIHKLIARQVALMEWLGQTPGLSTVILQGRATMSSLFSEFRG